MDALKQLRARLEARIADPKAKMFGLDSDLRAVLAGFDALSLQSDQLAAALIFASADLAQLNPNRGGRISSYMLEVAKVGPRAADALRKVQHGDRCHCDECM